MNKLYVLFITLALIFITSAVHANIIPLSDGTYEINYEFNLGDTLYGSDVTDIFILETNGSNVNVDYTFSAMARGPSTLSHIIDFEPTLALLLGMDRAPADSGLRDHLVVFMNNEFATEALTKPLYADVFPAIDGRDRVRESVLRQALVDGQLDDTSAHLILIDFFTLDAGKFAAFNPEGSFRVIEFTPPVAVDVVPEPATMLLLGTGLVGVAGAARRRKKNQA